ncbi:MAG TPA: enoyl-CoA hydratase/isomerase family protein [Candidatus Dormibacteraeota bacterium]|jgi:enoyl-CoA hydratase/carnithine racemase|nr:enoyl-CoA hydratase/isomerase family protein [Candidatus Dormibacteraeota bacterium]
MAVSYSRQDAVGVITLDRPPANSYDKGFLDEFNTSIDAARWDADAKAILLRSASEKFFSAGADVAWFAKTDAAQQHLFVIHANEVMSKLERTPKVVVAAINGHCLGGGLEIALSCDFRIAADGQYRIGLPEVTLGLLPGTGGTQRLPRLIGKQKALDLMLRGTALAPAQAAELGIVDEVVPSADLQAKALERATAYASGPTLAIGRIKLATVVGLGMPFANGLAYEHEAVARLFASEDATEGFKSFAEKRKPQYKGR